MLVDIQQVWSKWAVVERVVPPPTDAALVVVSEIPAECFNVRLLDELLHLYEVLRFHIELIVVVSELVVVVQSYGTAFFDFLDGFAFVLGFLKDSLETHE